jgi:hypothetical protein
MIIERRVVVDRRLRTAPAVACAHQPGSASLMRE